MVIFNSYIELQEVIADASSTWDTAEARISQGNSKYSQQRLKCVSLQGGWEWDMDIIGYVMICLMIRILTNYFCVMRWGHPTFYTILNHDLFHTIPRVSTYIDHRESHLRGKWLTMISPNSASRHIKFQSYHLAIWAKQNKTSDWYVASREKTCSWHGNPTCVERDIHMAIWLIKQLDSSMGESKSTMCPANGTLVGLSVEDPAPC